MIVKGPLVIMTGMHRLFGLRFGDTVENLVDTLSTLLDILFV